MFVFFPNHKHMMETKQIINPPKKHTFVFLCSHLDTHPQKLVLQGIDNLEDATTPRGFFLTGHHCGVEGEEVAKITMVFFYKMGPELIVINGVK